jgi:CubicO group peptidase (beta-lactamase class C family)
LKIDAKELKALLDEWREKHGVVGAAIGVLSEGKIEAAASGSLNVSTNVQATADSAFQIGSITKVFTATLMMQLVDEGRVDLDEPVVQYLPDFTLADPTAACTVTVRQLLNHTSGIDGDFFPADDPEGPSTVSYVRKMALLPNLYPPGQGPVTYSNSGYVVAGRIIEVLTGTTWSNAVMDRICRPLGMSVAFAHPHEALRFRCAMGHVPDPADQKKIIVAPVTYLPQSMAAAGSVLMMSAQSLLLFAKAHMDGGVYGEGKRLLSAESARAMRESKITVPPFTMPGVTHWGLGWSLGEGSEYRMAGHDGGTSGQFAYLRTFPERRVAYTLLINSLGRKLNDEVETLLLERFLGVSRIADPPREDFTVLPERYVGTYDNIATRIVVERKDGKITLRYIARSGTPPPLEFELEPHCSNVFALTGNPDHEGLKATFLEEEGARAKFMRLGPRMARRLPG